MTDGVRIHPGRLRLDHVSIAARSSDLGQRGFRVTSTDDAGLDQPHARLFLNRVYLEIVPAPTHGEVIGRSWFLHTPDLPAAAEALRSAGIRVGGPTTYKGLDGVWEDVEIDPPSATPAMPMVTRRVDRHAMTWPPPLSEAHPNGARTVKSLHVCTSDPARLLAVLTALGAEIKRGSALLEDDVTIEVAHARATGERIEAVTIGRDGAPPMSLKLTRESSQDRSEGQ